jgi:hypothetical protein
MGEHELVLQDRFPADRRRGTVLRSTVDGSGHRRRGTDVERVMAIDHDALRIGTMARRGWGLETLAYGPFDAVPGRTLSVHLLNGHNTSESYEIHGFLRRVGRWAFASETDGLLTRAVRFPRRRPRERLPRKLRYWWFNRAGRGLPVMTENLFVGWSPIEVLDDPGQSTGVLVRATGPFNGELLSIVQGRRAPHFRGLQNLPVNYVVALRTEGSITYASSAFPRAHGLPAMPHMRPLAIDPRPVADEVYATIGQALQGQIGFSCDTRVYGVTIADVEELAPWYTSASLADDLTGDGGGPDRDPAIGNRWVPVAGATRRGATGTSSSSDGFVEMRTTMDEPMGLVHVMLELEDDASAGIVWRASDAGDGWRLTLGTSGCRLVGREGGREFAVLEDNLPTSILRPISLQVLDDGHAAVITVDGQTMFGGAVDDDRLAVNLGVGLVFDGAAGGAVASRFECHPRLVMMPEPLQVPAVQIDEGSTVVVHEKFETERADLDGQTCGSRIWQRVLGDGVLAVEAGGPARFRASVAAPIPNRTAYAIDWHQPSFADLEIEVVPPPRDPAGARSRAGLLLWQDPRNYFIVNTWLDNSYASGSTSAFFNFNGFEDVYDAVWSNVGELIEWATPFRLGLRCDGQRFVVSVDDEPVLFRAFADVYPAFDSLRLRRVGIVANWEWGHDTGSAIRSFVARDRGPGPEEFTLQ